MEIWKLSQWFGAFSTSPRVTVHLSGSQATMLAVRPNPWRITAVGTVDLPHRSTGTAMDHLSVLGRGVSQLKDILHLGDADRIGFVADPVDAAVSYEDGTIDVVYEPTREAELVAAGRAAGFEHVTLEPVPLALLRLGYMSQGVPFVATGHGWLVLGGDEHVEFERRGDARQAEPVSLGPAPLTTRPLTGPYPVLAAGGVVPEGDWALPLGAALRSVGPKEFEVRSRELGAVLADEGRAT